jgi:hypothetical protein
LVLEELFGLLESLSDSLASPSCASVQADAATTMGSGRGTFPVRSARDPVLEP